MSVPPPSTAEHHDVWNLVPWFVNGRLSDGERRRVEAHLALCSACRDECEVQRRIYEVIAADALVEQMPTAGLNKLRRRIDAEERGTPRGRAFAARRPAMIAASVALLAVVVASLVTARWNDWHRPTDAAAYYTVTNSPPARADAVIRAVFSPTVTLSELQSLLDDARLRIVSGPTEAGVYSLAMTGSPSVGWSLARLRGHDTVRFAETIGPASSSIPPSP